ncbi:MAG: ankyrin repeat protein [Parasphingorhabdus sp.]
MGDSEVVRLIIVIGLLLMSAIPTYGAEQVYSAGNFYRDLNTALFDVIKRGLSKEALVLIQQGGNIEARDRSGNTALLLAARTARSKLVKKLIEMGANINHQNLIGSTAILRAASADRGKNVAILLEAGAEFNLRNNKGLTPITAAAFNGDEDSFQLLLDKGANPDVMDNSQKTAIVYAAAKGFVDIVRRLLNTGININQRYGNELTVLMWSAGYSNDVPPSDAVKMIQLLLDHDVALDLQDNRGWSAMMTAANMGHTAVVEILIKTGADVHITSKDNKTAAKLARAGGYLETLSVLNAVGAN